MSLTVLFALCILSIDFMLYFFFKLLYGEHRAKPRRLPPEYYADDFSSRISREFSSARKNRHPCVKKVLSMPPRKPEPSGANPVQQANAATPSKNSAELLAHRRIVSLFAQAKTRPQVQLLPAPRSAMPSVSSTPAR